MPDKKGQGDVKSWETKVKKGPQGSRVPIKVVEFEEEETDGRGLEESDGYR